MTADMSALREEITPQLQRILPTLEDVAQDLHSHPEIRFEEHHAARRLVAEARAAGFEVEAPYAGLDTAFVGRWSAPGSTETSPTIAVFCEFDALEEIGHACGHNIIAAAGLGAGMLIRQNLLQSGTPGHLMLIGSPAEEGGGGKVPMIEAGVLDGVDLAMMVHPAGEDAVSATILSRVALDVSFTGRASHAAGAPTADATHWMRPRSRSPPSGCCASSFPTTPGSTRSSPTAARRPTSSRSTPGCGSSSAPRPGTPCWRTSCRGWRSASRVRHWPPDARSASASPPRPTTR